jgi:hypothetical protein
LFSTLLVTLPLAVIHLILVNRSGLGDTGLGNAGVISDEHMLVDTHEATHMFGLKSGIELTADDLNATTDAA